VCARPRPLRQGRSFALHHLTLLLLQVLDRMEDFSLPYQTHNTGRWARAGRAVMALVVMGCVVGLCGNCVAAVYRSKAARIANESGAEFLANTTASFQVAVDLLDQASHQVQLAADAESVQEFSEVFVLLVLISSFLIVGAMCARRVTAALTSMILRSATMTARSNAAAWHLHRQIVVTVAVVFITFLPRAAYAALNAVSNLMQDIGSGCLNVCADTPESQVCPQPFNQYTHIQLYLNYSPEFQLLVVLISSPLALIVALWGMTSARMLRAMKRSARDLDTVHSSILRPASSLHA
jgi:hypothetical protein